MTIATAWPALLILRARLLGPGCYFSAHMASRGLYEGGDGPIVLNRDRNGEHAQGVSVKERQVEAEYNRKGDSAECTNSIQHDMCLSGQLLTIEFSTSSPT